MQQCSFCKKPRNRVRYLITGTDEAICNECVDKYIDILKDKGLDLIKKRVGPKLTINPRKGRVHCTFCGKSQDFVQKVIAGPDVYICNECVDLCIEILIENDLSLIEKWIEREAESPTTIIRTVTLPLEYYQVGLSLIAYFAMILKYRYQSVKIKTNLELDNRTIRLVVGINEEDKDNIQKLLKEYGLVIQGRVPPERLLYQVDQLRELQERLSMTTLELKRLSEVKRQSGDPESGEQESIEEKVIKLQNALGWIFRREVEDIEDLFM